MKYPAGAVIAVVVILGSVGAAAQNGSITSTRLTEQLHLLSTDQDSYTTNTIAFVGTDGMLLVDTQSADDAEELKKAVDAFDKGAPKYIINFDEFPDATFPDITVVDSLTLYFNGERIEMHALPGSHDDNEIIVHFTESKVVHLSSLVNGFNFPSVDSDGDALRFAELVARAIGLLPEDVVIVSGHNHVGTWKDLHAYHEMLVGTTETVRKGLAEGKDLATLQEEQALDQWKSYAGSYVSVDEWTEYLVEALQQERDDRKTVFEPLYHAWKDEGAEAAVEFFEARSRPERKSGSGRRP